MTPEVGFHNDRRFDDSEQLTDLFLPLSWTFVT